MKHFFLFLLFIPSLLGAKTDWFSMLQHSKQAQVAMAGDITSIGLYAAKPNADNQLFYSFWLGRKACTVFIQKGPEYKVDGGHMDWYDAEISISNVPLSHNTMTDYNRSAKVVCKYNYRTKVFSSFDVPNSWEPEFHDFATQLSGN